MRMTRTAKRYNFVFRKFSASLLTREICAKQKKWRQSRTRTGFPTDLSNALELCCRATSPIAKEGSVVTRPKPSRPDWRKARLLDKMSAVLVETSARITRKQTPKDNS